MKKLFLRKEEKTEICQKTLPPALTLFSLFLYREREIEREVLVFWLFPIWKICSSSLHLNSCSNALIIELMFPKFLWKFIHFRAFRLQKLVLLSLSLSSFQFSPFLVMYFVCCCILFYSSASYLCSLWMFRERIKAAEGRWGGDGRGDDGSEKGG